ncbi:hypothetical protein DFH08DRAFT_817827 [Mycena albidolilacea]|uniref:Uncharacterized protein n=1 Tax=Mycena albidolilacea TaxID=1033008 RepID=A0AAD7EGI7_9AGAR|nr:hypothetical protein DFH08DRAFT_817827 [Mycena albidolilacea]
MMWKPKINVHLVIDGSDPPALITHSILAVSGPKGALRFLGRPGRTLGSTYPAKVCLALQAIAVQLLSCQAMQWNMDNINFAGYCGTTDTGSYVAYKNGMIKTLLSMRLICVHTKTYMDIKDFVISTLVIKHRDGLDPESYSNICLHACLTPNESVSLRPEFPRIIGFRHKTVSQPPSKQDWASEKWCRKSLQQAAVAAGGEVGAGSGRSEVHEASGIKLGCIVNGREIKLTGFDFGRGKDTWSKRNITSPPFVVLLMKMHPRLNHSRFRLACKGNLKLSAREQTEVPDARVRAGAGAEDPEAREESSEAGTGVPLIWL